KPCLGERCNGVDPNAIALQLDRRCAGEPVNSCFGRCVVRLSKATQHAGYATGVYDPSAPTLLLHYDGSSLSTQEGAGQVDSDYCVPLLLGHFEESLVANDARIVDQDIHSPILVYGLSDQRLGSQSRGYIIVIRCSLATGCMDGLHDCICCRCVLP